MSTKKYILLNLHFFKRKLFSWGKKIGQLYQQSWLWEARFITSGLMGCEKLALLSARRPLLLPLRGLRSCQEEAAIPDCSVSCLHSYNVLIQRGLGSVKLGGLLLVLATHTLAFSPLCKRWCPSHLPRLSLRGIIGSWPCVASHCPGKFFFCRYIFSKKC